MSDNVPELIDPNLVLQAVRRERRETFSASSEKNTLKQELTNINMSESQTDKKRDECHLLPII